MIYKIKDPVYFCGDLHGNFHWLKPYILQKNLSDCSIVFCGDIGLGFKPLETWHKWVHGLGLTGELRKRQIDCYFIRGNHDDPSWFDDHTLVTRHFKAVSDYSVLSSPTHNILCVGGGISIDRNYRMEQQNIALHQYALYHPNSTRDEAMASIQQIYWPTEPPIYDECAIDNLTKQIDIVCSHVAPIQFPPFTQLDKYWFRQDPKLEQDCAYERQIMSKVLERLRHNQHPVENWIYGHYHFSDTGVADNVKYHLLNMARDGSLSMIGLDYGG